MPETGSGKPRNKPSCYIYIYMSSPINRVNCRIPQETPILNSPPKRTHNSQNSIAPQSFILYSTTENERNDETAYIYIYIRRIARRISRNMVLESHIYIYIYIYIYMAHISAHISFARYIFRYVQEKCGKSSP